jgi:hypothetical protein
LSDLNISISWSREAYPECAEYLAPFSQLVDDLRDLHSSGKTFMNILVHVRRAWRSMSIYFPAIKTSKIAQEKWTMDQD